MRFWLVSMGVFGAIGLFFDAERDADAGKLLLDQRRHLGGAIGDDEGRAQEQLVRHVTGVEQLSGALGIVAVRTQGVGEPEVKRADDGGGGLGKARPDGGDDFVYVNRQIDGQTGLRLRKRAFISVEEAGHGQCVCGLAPPQSVVLGHGRQQFESGGEIYLVVSAGRRTVLTRTLVCETVSSENCES